MKKSLTKFINKNFNEEKSLKIIKYYEKEMNKMMIKEKLSLTNTQYKTAVKSILPVIAIYKALQLYESAEESMKYTEEYFYDEAKPFKLFIEGITFTNIGTACLKKIFNIFIKADTWDSNVYQYDKEHFNFDITRCLYHDLCKKYDCSELTPSFCEGDYFVFGNMRTLQFTRNQTLGQGGEKCDFHFAKK